MFYKQQINIKFAKVLFNDKYLDTIRAFDKGCTIERDWTENTFVYTLINQNPNTNSNVYFKVVFPLVHV